MNSQILPRFSLLSIPTLFLFLQFPFSLANPDPDEVFYSSCGATFNCGSIAGVGYPFRGYQEPEFCGYPGLVLTCGNNNITTLVINDIKFRVLDINPSAQTMNIAREDVMEATCPQELVNTTLDNSLFEYSSSYMNLTFLYGCPAPITLIPGIDQIGTCNVSGYSGVYLMPGTFGWVGCDVSVTVPVSNLAGSINSTDLGEAVETGFGVKWKVDTSVCSGCTGSGGRCGYSSFSNQTTCYCPNPPYVSGTCLMTVGAGAPSPSKITPGCRSSVIVRVNRTVALGLVVSSPSSYVEQVLDSGFGLRWGANDSICNGCARSGGVCGSDSGSGFACYCWDQVYPVTCNSTRRGNGMCL